MTFRQPRTTPRPALFFLAALIAALAAILVGTTSSASAAGVAETRVRASADPAGVLVGPPEHIAAGQRLGNEPSRVVVVVATGVAAKTGAKTCLRSFAGATVVLMADGTRKPIEHIKVGDEVVATDPETGERVTRKVTRVWAHDDQVLDLVVDGKVITTTEDHLFWSVTDQRFERADQLAAGEIVLGDGGRQITVSGFRPGTSRTALAYNLSIAGVHTYHVGDGEILVHNDCSDAAIEVARGHGLGHLDEIPGVSSIDELASYVDRVMAPGSGAVVRPLNRGRTAYWDEGAQSIIIHNSREPWRSTVFVPTRGFQKFMDLD